MTIEVEDARGRAEVIELRAESCVLDLSCNVAPDSEDATEATMPYEGWTSAAIIAWPAGCRNRVGVRIIVDGEQLFPRNAGWTALEDTTIGVTLLKKVRKDRIIRAEFKNNDIENSHWISVLVQVSALFPVWARLL